MPEENVRLEIVFAGDASGSPWNVTVKLLDVSRIDTAAVTWIEQRMQVQDTMPETTGILVFCVSRALAPLRRYVWWAHASHHGFDDIRHGDFITMRQAPCTQDDSVRGVTLSLERVT